jgi:hypothetical protein
MTDSPSITVADRRASKRLAPRKKIRIECRRGLLGLGPNLALEVADVSQTGACVLTERRLANFDEVEVMLSSTTWTKPIKVQGLVVRVYPVDEQRQSVGIRFFKPLSYQHFNNLT